MATGFRDLFAWTLHWWSAAAEVVPTMPGLEYTGKLTGNTIDGSVTPMGQGPIPLAVTKE